MTARLLFLVSLLVFTSCKKGSSSATSGSGSASTGSAAPQSSDAAAQTGSAPAAPADAATASVTQPPAESLARKALDAQMATFTTHDDAALAALFTPKAIVLAPRALEVADASNQPATIIPRMLGGKTLKGQKVDKLVAGGTQGMVWFAADISLTQKDADATLTRTLRVLELLDGSSDWKAGVGSVAEFTPLGAARHPSELHQTTTAGPLAQLLTSPADAAAALADAPNVIVQGTEEKEYAVGPEATKKLLGSWKDLGLSIEGKSVNEVHTTNWGYAFAYVNMPKKDSDVPYRMAGLLIAVPNGDSWRVVAVHYLPL